MTELLIATGVATEIVRILTRTTYMSRGPLAEYPTLPFIVAGIGIGLSFIFRHTLNSAGDGIIGATIMIGLLAAIVLGLCSFLPEFHINPLKLITLHGLAIYETTIHHNLYSPNWSLTVLYATPIILVSLLPHIWKSHGYRVLATLWSLALTIFFSLAIIAPILTLYELDIPTAFFVGILFVSLTTTAFFGAKYLTILIATLLNTKKIYIEKFVHWHNTLSYAPDITRTNIAKTTGVIIILVSSNITSFISPDTALLIGLTLTFSLSSTRTHKNALTKYTTQPTKL